MPTRKPSLLVEMLPEALRFFKPELNPGVDIMNETISSKHMVTWGCPDCGAESKVSIANKVAREAGTVRFCGCRKCTTTEIGSVVEMCPEVKDWFDPDLNPGIDLTTLTVSSQTKVKWKCPQCGKIKEMPPNTKVILKNGIHTVKGCISCRFGIPSRIKTGINDLLTLCPEAAEWLDPELNPSIDLTTLAVSSHKKVKWRCPKCDAVTEEMPHNKISKRDDGSYYIIGCTDCGYCKPREVIFGKNDLVTICPNIVDWFDSDLNPGIDLTTLAVSSSTKVKWKCPQCGEIKEMSPNAKVKLKNRIPTVSGCFSCRYGIPSRIKTGINDLLTLCPEAAEWLDPELNPSIDLSRLSVNSGNLVKWRCPKCGAVTEKITHNKIAKRDDGSCYIRGCGDCGYGTPREVIFGKNDLVTICPNIVDWFDPDLNPGIDLTTLAVSSNTKVKWKCPQCGKIKEISPGDKVILKNGIHTVRGCISCRYGIPTKVETGVNDLLTLCPEAAEWVDNELDPGVDLSIMSVGASRRLHWKCPNCSYVSETFTCSKIKKYDDGKYHVLSCKFCNYGSDNAILPGINDVTTLTDGFDDWSFRELNPDVNFLYRSPGSKVVVKFRCPDCGSIREAPLDSKTTFVGDGRYKIIGCSICGYDNWKPAPGEDAETLLPECKEWFVPELNPNISLSSLSVYSNVPLKLMCPGCKTIVETSLAKKSRRMPDGTLYFCGCSLCGYGIYATPGVDDITITCPDIIDWIRPENNQNIRLNHLSFGSSTKLVFTCPNCGDSTTDSLTSRLKRDAFGSPYVRGCYNCNYGTSYDTYDGTNDVVSEYPGIMPWFKEELNPGIDLHVTTRYSKKHVNWTCPNCGDVTESTIAAKIKFRSDGGFYIEGCKKCSYGSFFDFFDGTNDIATVFPEVLEWYKPELNPGIDLHVTPRYSKKHVNWSCPNCGDVTESTIAAKVNLKPDGGFYIEGCKKCAYGTSYDYFDGTNDIATVFPEVLEWYKPELNPDVDLHATPRYSKKHVNWSCPNCGDVTESTIAAKVKLKPDGGFYIEGCKKCAYGTSYDTFDGTNDIATAFPEVLEWYKPELNPDVDLNRVY